MEGFDLFIIYFSKFCYLFMGFLILIKCFVLSFFFTKKWRFVDLKIGPKIHASFKRNISPVIFRCLFIISLVDIVLILLYGKSHFIQFYFRGNIPVFKISKIYGIFMRKSD